MPILPTQKIPHRITDASKEEETQQEETVASGNIEERDGILRLRDMFHFDNIGFTKTKDPASTVKYLICAACDLGPLGWHDTTEPNAFHLVLARVSKNKTSA